MKINEFKLEAAEAKAMQLAEWPELVEATINECEISEEAKKILQEMKWNRLRVLEVHRNHVDGLQALGKETSRLQVLRFMRSLD